MPPIARGQTWRCQTLPVSTVPNTGRNLSNSNYRVLDEEYYVDSSSRKCRYVDPMLECSISAYIFPLICGAYVTRLVLALAENKEVLTGKHTSYNMLFHLPTNGFTKVTVDICI